MEETTTGKKRKLTDAERAEIAAQSERTRANAQRARELAQRAQAKLDAERPGNYERRLKAL